ncbi:hypothetical protein ZWY2020_011357 [Hordeum vulgare]|nr:hypothetical protein ZWY2020_011357 [Hordeum vulgare]
MSSPVTERDQQGRGAPKLRRPQEAARAYPGRLQARRRRAAGQRSKPLPLSALVPFLPPPVDAAPINAVPLSAVAPRAEPAWIRAHFNLRLDLTVTFIDEKAVTATDLDPAEPVPAPGSGRAAQPPPDPLPDELDAAKIPCEGAKGKPQGRQGCRRPKREVQQGRTKRKKKQGKKHGRLPVLVCNVTPAPSSCS